VRGHSRGGRDLRMLRLIDHAGLLARASTTIGTAPWSLQPSRFRVPLLTVVLVPEPERV
jgi:hypothetical protein